jgi:CRISPR-associated endonuclease Cas1
MQAQATCPLPPLVPREGVLVVDGYGVRVFVRHRHLVVEDGFGSDRRSATFTRATSGIRRLVLLGSAGFVSLEAVRWLADVGSAFVHLDRSGQILAISGTPGLDHPALRRAQALAASSRLGLEIARGIVAEKLRGQASVVASLPALEGATEGVEQALVDLERAMTLGGILVAEAAGAAAYWASWESVGVTLARPAKKKMPEHWLIFGKRSSPLTGSPRLAVNPANAILNYLYALLEAEARLACLAVGLDPGIGIVHADQRARDSLALDLMEAVRPKVDAYVLNLLQSRTFRASDFHETRQGACRVLLPLTHYLAETAPAWAKALAPVAEWIAKMLAGRAGARKTPTPLTQDNRSAGRDGVRRGSRKVRDMGPKAPPAACRTCGEALASEDRAYCDECVIDHRRGTLRGASTAANATLTSLRAGGKDPAHGREAAKKRARSLALRRQETKTYEAVARELPSREFFIQEILPRLAGVPIRAMARATGLTRGYCSMIRRGIYVPHQRHWEALKRLTDRVV